MSNTWEVLALKYASRNDRTRADSFIFDDNHDVNHPMDYFIWVLRQRDKVIVVDTGYDDAEGHARSRPVSRHPTEALAGLNIDASSVTTVIITHLHYDHAGCLTAFPNATLHVQAAELAYATGPCMCHDVLRMPYTGEHVCDLVRSLYAGRVNFHEGDGEVADGVTVHCIGGHSRGLQAVRVRTESGWLCLASDAAHYYENVLARKPFPVVVDLQAMLDGFTTLEKLASKAELVVPGHDPIVTRIFPMLPQADFIWRLDRGPDKPVEF